MRGKVMHIDDTIEEKAKSDSSYAIAYALLQVARAQKETAVAIRNLDIAHMAEMIDTAGAAISSAIREEG